MPAPFAAGGAGGLLESVLLEAPALLERSVAYTRTSLSLLPSAAPDAPTPCREWTLVRLLRHMDDSLAALTEAADVGYVAPAGPAEQHPGLLAASLRERACRLLGAWAHEPARRHVSVAGRDMPSSLLAATGAIEIVVHGWDVARACGEDRPVPEALACSLLTVAPVVVAAEDRTGGPGRSPRFASPYDVAPTASASERLLAFLGRR